MYAYIYVYKYELTESIVYAVFYLYVWVCIQCDDHQELPDTLAWSCLPEAVWPTLHFTSALVAQ